MKRTFSAHRISTPMDRHKRAVAYRHQPYVKKNEYSFVPAEQEEVAVEKKIEKVETTAVEAEKPFQKIEIKPEKKTRAQKKAEKKLAFDQAMDELADEPHASILSVLIKPIECMQNAAQTDSVMHSSLLYVVVLLLEWLAVGSFFGCICYQLISVNAFSISRLSFSDTAAIAFKIGLFGWIAEMLVHKVWKFSQHDIDFKKMNSLYVYGIGSSAVVMFIATGLMLVKPAIATALFAVAFLFSVYYRFAVHAEMHATNTKGIITISVCTFAALLVFNAMVPMLFGNVIKIFMTLMNL